jgi:hypothetical protein
METDDIPPTTLKPAPVTVASEIVTGAVPVLVRVRVWGLLDPGATFPKLKLVAFAASVPDGVELDFDAGDPAPANPVHPATDSTARHARIRANMPSDSLQTELGRKWKHCFVLDFMMDVA